MVRVLPCNTRASGAHISDPSQRTAGESVFSVRSRSCRIRTVALFVALVLAATVWSWQQAAAQVAGDQVSGGASGVSTSGDSTSAEEGASGSIGEILTAGGPVGILILLLSLAAVALVFEHIMTIRQAVIMPPGLSDDVRALLIEGQIAAARERCRQQPSFLAFVMEAGMGEVDGGWPAVEKALEDAAADQSARLFRKIEYLSVIGNIAPMLGLLGTVIGMIFAFREVANTQGAARAADLAEGIYLALVTTVEGLIVAIPSLAAFAVFRNRVDQLVAEASYAAQHAFIPLKRLRAAGAGRTRNVAPPSPPPLGGQ